MNSVARKFDIAKTTREFHKKHHSYHIWQRIVAGLSCIVVFCTTYALIIPAITLEKKEPICGHEAHLHTDDCYAPVHVHTSECYQPNGREPYVCPVHAGEAPTYCGYADFVLHTHSAGCFNADGTLVCALPEISEHVHGEGCYSQTEETAGNGTFTETPEGEAVTSPENGDALVSAPTPADGEQSESGEAMELPVDSDISTETVTDAETEGQTALSVIAEHNGKLLGAPSNTDTIEAVTESVNTEAVTELETEVVTEPESETEAVTESINTEPVTEAVTEPNVADTESTAPILTCTLPQVQYHLHTAACYADGALICGKTQLLYPVCTTTGTVSINENGAALVCTCGMEEHEHVDACYPDDREPSYVKGEIYHCGFGEHTHTDACYDAEGTLICTLPEHTHTDACKNPDDQKENRYVCGMEAHLHTIVCFGEDGTLTCQIPVHEHTEDCLPPVYYCGLPEHAHTAECLDDKGELVCTAEEHTHRVQCTSNPDADVESKEEWEAALPARTGNARYDLIAIAQSQLGVEESRENFYVDETGALRGITRYGQFSGDPYTKNYDNWSAYFVNFCLHYAVKDAMQETLFVANADMWMQGLLDAGKFVPKTEIFAKPSVMGSDSTAEDCAGAQTCAVSQGDIAFFDRDGDGSVNSVGIVTGYDAETGVFQVMEGDRDGMGAVETQDIAADDAALLGFGVLFDEPYLETLTEEEQAEVDAVIGWIDAIPSLEEIEATMTELEENGTIEVDGEEIDEEVYMEGLTSQVSFVYTYYHSYLTPAQQAHVTNAEKLAQYEWLYVDTLALTEDCTCNIYGVNGWGYTNQKYSVIYNKNSQKPNSYWFAYVMKPILDKTNTFEVQNIYISDTSGSNPTITVPENGFIHFVHKDAATDVFSYFPTPEIGGIVTVSDDFWKKNATFNGNTVYGTITYWIDEPDIGLKKEKDNTENLTTIDTISTNSFIELNLYDYEDNINTPYINSNHKYPGFQNTGAGQNTYPALGDIISKDCQTFGGVTSAKNVINNNTDITGGKVNNKDIWINYPISWKYPENSNDWQYVKIMSNTLQNGYPALADGTSLKYLFSEETLDGVQYAKKVNTHSSIDYLFQYNAETGVYTYDSRKNHAQFVPGTDDSTNPDRFEVYDAILTPNYLIYAFGNFLPLNDIVHDSAPITEINMEYMRRIRNTAQDKYDNYNSDRYDGKLVDNREAYKNLVTAIDNNVLNKSNDWTIKKAALEYYEKSSGIPFPATHVPQNPTTIEEQYIKDIYSREDSQIYSLDFDEPSNFFFGMEMKMNFMQSKNGKTTKGQPMVLSFVGDDDVWFYIDDYLFLDLSGIHRQVGGQIDFEKGEVRYYRLYQPYGDVVMDEKSLITTVKFADILGEEGAHLLNEKGTFKNYSFHSLNFYYMERGSGSGVCRLEFNMEQTIPTSINKVDQYGDPIEGAEFAVYHAERINEQTYQYYNCITGDDAEDHSACFHGTPVTVPGNIVPDPETGILKLSDGSTIKPCYTGQTNEEGTLTFVNKKENTYYSIGEMELLFGTNFILREYYIPDGYRTVADEIYLKIENGTIQCDNPYRTGTWAGPNALVTGTSELVRAASSVYDAAFANIPAENKTADGKIKFTDGSGKKTGTLFAVILKRNMEEKLPDGEISDWKNIDFSKWYPVYGNGKDGYTVLTDFGERGNNMELVIEAAKQAQKYGENCFSIGMNQQPQLVIENAPGSADQYLSYILEKQYEDTQEAIDSLQYTAAYYYTAADSLEGATADNTVRISTHFDEAGKKDAFTVQWGSTISVPNIENRYIIQKTAPDQPDEYLNDAVFAMYHADEDEKGNLYYIANNETSSNEGTRIYLEPDDDGDNRGRAGLEPGVYNGTYEIQAGITIPTEHNGNVTLASGGDIAVTVNGQNYTIKPAVNAKNERLVTYSHDSCAIVNESTTAHFTALKEGRYVLREIQSPDGYALNTTEVKVMINGSGIYVNAGTADDDVMVGNGAGYIVASIENSAREDGVDETLTWIYTMLNVNTSKHFKDAFNEDGSLISQGYAKKSEEDQLAGYGSDIERIGSGENADIEARRNAMVTYLAYDSTKSGENGTLFDYFPNSDQDNRLDNEGMLTTRNGEGTQQLFTEEGWSELAVYQDYYFGKNAILEKDQKPIYEDRKNTNLTSLFSKSRFVRFTDQRLNDLKIVKVDAYDSTKKLMGAAFALARQFKDGERFYQYQNEQVSYVVPAENQTASDFKIPVNDNGELIFHNLTSGVYKLYEIDAPEGYKLLSDPITITVKNGKIETVDSNGKDIFALSNSGAPDAGQPMEMNVINSNSYTLPMTGVFGGTFFCTFGGLLLMTAPIVYIICTGRCTTKGRRRKKERRVNAR